MAYSYLQGKLLRITEW